MVCSHPKSGLRLALAIPIRNVCNCYEALILVFLLGRECTKETIREDRRGSRVGFRSGKRCPYFVKVLIMVPAFHSEEQAALAVAGEDQ